MLYDLNTYVPVCVWTMSNSDDDVLTLVTFPLYVQEENGKKGNVICGAKSG